MAEWKTEWNERLKKRPLAGRQFSPQMMQHVVERIRRSDRRKKRFRVFRIAAVSFTFFLLLAVPSVVMIMQKADFHTVPGSVNPNHTGERVPQREPLQHVLLQPEDGGEVNVWNEMEVSTYEVSDQTLIRFVRALMQRKLGIWGPSSPDIDALWERPEDKKALERYDISSPWISEVYVQTSEVRGAYQIYELRLRLTDSTSAEFSERLRVSISKHTQLIHEVLILHEDEEEQYAESN